MRKIKKNHDPIYTASLDQDWIGIVTRISINSNSDSSSSYSTNNSSRNTMLSEGGIISGSSESDNESQYSIIDPAIITDPLTAVAVAAISEVQSHDGSDVAVATASTLQYDRSSVEDEDDDDHDEKNELLLSDDDSPPTLEISFNSFSNNDSVEIEDEDENNDDDENKSLLSAINDNFSKQESEGEIVHRENYKESTVLQD